MDLKVKVSSLKAVPKNARIPNPQNPNQPIVMQKDILVIECVSAESDEIAARLSVDAEKYPGVKDLKISQEITITI